MQIFESIIAAAAKSTRFQPVQRIPPPLNVCAERATYLKLHWYIALRLNGAVAESSTKIAAVITV